jgi:hypothetical protein
MGEDLGCDYGHRQTLYSPTINAAGAMAAATFEPIAQRREGFMKLTIVLLAAACAIGFSSDVSARGCKELQAKCVAKGWGNARQCQLLYESAIKEGGVWMSPAARAAAKVPPGGSGSCGVQ